MKNIYISVIIILISMFYSTKTIAQNMQIADQAFIDKDYNLAMTEYKKAARIGNAKAFYQLSRIYFKGLGVNKNELLGIVWMAVAAEHEYDNAAENLQKIKSKLNPVVRSEVDTIIDNYVNRYSKEAITTKYYPTLLTDMLEQPISLENDGQITNFDIIMAESHFPTNNNSPGWIKDVLDENDRGDEYSADDITDMAINMPYYLVVDYDIAPDGSIRDTRSAITMGDDNRGLELLNLMNVGEPKFAEKNVYFLNRAIFGIENIDTISMRREHTEFYTKTLRFVSKLKGSEDPVVNYNHAMALMFFPWLRGTDEQIDALLKRSALAGVSLAQFEYGLKLYRQQSSLEQAVYWLGEAAKQGLTKAEYRLARILLESPWVESDVNKANFWFSQAALKKHVVAVRKLVQLKLTAENTDLYDPKGAMTLLNSITAQQNENPEYYYLLALAYSKAENRQFSVALENLRKAISLAKNLNWDTQQWQETLKTWVSSGTVTVTEI